MSEKPNVIKTSLNDSCLIKSFSDGEVIKTRKYQNLNFKSILHFFTSKSDQKTIYARIPKSTARIPQLHHFFRNTTADICVL